MGANLFSGRLVQADEAQPLGCLPGGQVFDLFTPDAVPLRTTAYMTPFGTLNTNIVLGDDPSGAVAIAAIDLAERIGEYLPAVASTSPIPLAMRASEAPAKYLEQKTMLLCGGPDENALVKRLVDEGKSKVDWKAAEVGQIEVVEQAFGGPGTAVILGGSTSQGSVYAINAFTEFFKHLAGATLAQAKMLEADRQLRRGDIAGAADSFVYLLNGLRVDGSAKFFVPIKNPSPKFEQQLKDEAKLAQEVGQLLSQGPSLEEAEAQFQELASRCTYCHERYLSFDFKGTNRMQYLFSQFPDTRIETQWAKAD
ncbi:MAG: hypothetical protein C1943_04925 [Halochromatium sp.]|nr:hypothetical protein [Halochromatium sp.]